MSTGWRWRVQAFLWTGTEDKPYLPTYHRWKWQARKQARKLRDSHAPGMARIEIRRVGDR